MSDETEPLAEPKCATHPEAPSAGTCTHCGNFGCEQCLGHIGDKLVCRTCVDEERVAAFPNTPWEQRKTLGVWGGLWGTVKALSTQPSKTFEGIDPDAGLDEPVKLLLVAHVAAGLGIAVLILIGGLGLSLVMAATGEVGGGEAAIVAAVAIVYGLMIAIMTPLQGIMYAFVLGLIVHGALKLLGGGNRGLTTTLRASLYAGVIMFWNVTICGGMITWIWWLILQILGTAKLQGDPVGKVAAAVLLPTFLCCGGYMGLVGLMVLIEEM
jgi:hypothetical protein